MKIPLFFPIPLLVSTIDVQDALPLHVWIDRAGVPCRASGRWIDRPVVAAPNTQTQREPGDWGAVRVGVPQGLSSQDEARYVVVVMAFSVMDLVARESIRGAAWARPSPPPGRAPTGLAKSNRERQRTHRRQQGRALVADVL